MNLLIGQKLYESFVEVSDSMCQYFSTWTYNEPIIITKETYYKMQRVQKLLYKSIRYFVEHYDDFRILMPVSERIYEILSLYKDKPYRVGTYRTDFLFDKNNNIKLIEITCRFALNGFFTTGYFNRMADKYLENQINVQTIDAYKRFYDYLMRYFGEFDHVCILKGSDDRNETKHIIDIFEKAGYRVHVIHTDSISEKLYLLDNAAVIGELDHEEICSLPTDTIRSIIHSNLINDLRTVFLIHDKRFFSVLYNNDFLNAALSEDERNEFMNYLLPTYTWGEKSEIVAHVKNNKNKWIIKPSVFGKSIDVYAGCATSEDEWQVLFTEERIKKMVFQSYVEQRKFAGAIKGKHYEDYAAGTLLFFDDNFFGPGLFRASSFPVTNKVDDRKIFSIVTDDITDSNSFIIV